MGIIISHRVIVSPHFLKYTLKSLNTEINVHYFSSDLISNDQKITSILL